MTRLYLHIGTEKTGTTSIQRFLDVNRGVLRQNGILFPTAPGRRNQTQLAVAAQNDRKRGDKRLRKKLEIETASDAQVFRERLCNELAEELAASDCSTVIMSTEHCSSRLLRPLEVPRLRDLLSPLFSDIRIVVYLRRQDDFLLSTYSTSVKSGSTEALRIPGPRMTEAHYDHWVLLSRWAEAFGQDRMICRRFEKSELKGGDVVDDFLDAIGIAGRPPFRRPAAANESLDASSLEFLRLFNKFVPGSDATRGRLLRLLNSRPSDGTLVTLDPEELAAFMARFTESNRKVANTYFGGERRDSDDPLFPSRSDRRARARPAPLTAEQAVEISAWLWRRGGELKREAAKPKTGGSRVRRQKHANAASRPAA
ncbi:MAG TPA: hypothetical protein VJU82_11770 [Acidobacteriaceae bacterium]|nr:hypothetical protein [Acidobacteriaceae bacterium]